MIISHSLLNAHVVFVIFVIHLIVSLDCILSDAVTESAIGGMSAYCVIESRSLLKSICLVSNFPYMLCDYILSDNVTESVIDLFVSILCDTIPKSAESTGRTETHVNPLLLVIISAEPGN